MERRDTTEEVEKILKERQKIKAFKDRCNELRSERVLNGIKFYDIHGSGRIRKGNKHYD